MKPIGNRPCARLAIPPHQPIAWHIILQGPDVFGFYCNSWRRRKGTSAVRLAKDDDVIEALAAERADQSLRMSV